MSASEKPIDIPWTGLDLIGRPALNKGTAFTETERDAFELHGLLPPHVGSLGDQTARRLKALRAFATDFDRYAYLRDLQDTNETLFYALVVRHLEELLPIVYTPTVGEGCQRFSEIWRRPRGLFLSYPNMARIRSIIANRRLDRVRVIVVSDGERILGLGDQGAGGMGIPIGKLALYTACAGIDPEETLPIFLDVGTNNRARMDDPLYVGWRHERVRGNEYDAFIEEFIAAVIERWPNVLLQWEDFAGSNAARMLDRYRDRLCTFNDDIQGTAAVATGAILSAIQVTKLPLTAQRIAIVGAGSAGCGIASLLCRAMVDAGAAETDARRAFFAVDREGLLVEGMPGITREQAPFVQPRSAVSTWTRTRPDRIDLVDVAINAKPTALIGVSGQNGAFTEEVVRAMAKGTPRPIVFPLSNPSSRSEATPEDLLRWTEGRALVGTGSPFPPVYVDGKPVVIDQTNNAYIFPGVGLGVLAVGARRVTDAMFMAAAKALADLSPARESAVGGPSERLLPPVERLRDVAVAVAHAVAREALRDDPAAAASIAERIEACIWEPRYRAYRRSL